MSSLTLLVTMTVVLLTCDVHAYRQRNQIRRHANIEGTALQLCSTDPMTGWRRDGYCKTYTHDYGTHVVCAEMTQEFLEFTASRGNPLSTPNPRYGFPGLKPGDKWCLCALRWREAYRNNKAPKLVVSATHSKALRYVPKSTLLEYGLEN